MVIIGIQNYIKIKNYHQEKSLLAKEKGIKLIHIWEWEWNDIEDKIKVFIKSKLGIYCQKIGARQCIVKEIKNQEYQKFLQ